VQPKLQRDDAEALMDAAQSERQLMDIRAQKGVRCWAARAQPHLAAPMSSSCCSALEMRACGWCDDVARLSGQTQRP
jgi:hypothetical protein